MPGPVEKASGICKACAGGDKTFRTSAIISRITRKIFGNCFYLCKDVFRKPVADVSDGGPVVYVSDADVYG